MIDQYCRFFDQEQNKEVLHMALDHVAEIMLKMQEPAKHKLDAQAASYFDNKFKLHFK